MFDAFATLALNAANDNDPAYNPQDWDAFDPAEMPEDFFYEDDTVMDVATFMSRYA